jgi:hypothetical protein
VWRFIVPALLALHVPRERITLLRRSPQAELHPALRGMRVVWSLQELSPDSFGMSLNCVPAPLLVEMQEALMTRFPAAIHFCDTPGFDTSEKRARVAKLALKNVLSLEDWPFMPNLAFFVREMRNPGRPKTLRIQNFGIFTHFLSIYRAIHGGRRPFGRTLVKDEVEVTGAPHRAVLVKFRYKKDLPVAKIALHGPHEFVEDFFEVEREPHEDDEVLYRVIDGGSVLYHRGKHLLCAKTVNQALVDTFRPLQNRKNVHELDKFVGLVDMLEDVLSGRLKKPYRYANSVRDTLTSHQLTKSERCIFL